MTFLSRCKLTLLVAATFVFTFCYGTTTTEAQGFRIGRVLQAGNGQGFRLGGPRAGMHFGGGQGASFGVGNFGMRFGNGQGARFGGQNYGMQFGGGQGTQIGRITTTPAVQPGTYFYQDVRSLGYAPSYPVSPNVVAGTATYTGAINAAPGVIPAANQPPMASPLVPAPLQSGTPVSSVVTAEPTTNSPAGFQSTAATQSQKEIRILYPADAKKDLKYSLNGTDFELAPGKTMVLDNGFDWELVFSAGGEHGEREANLTASGNYFFQHTEDEGWVLLQEETEPATDVAPVVPAADDANSVIESAKEETTIAPVADEAMPSVVAPENEAPSNDEVPSSDENSSTEENSSTDDSSSEKSPSSEEEPDPSIFDLDSNSESKSESVPPIEEGGK